MIARWHRVNRIRGMVFISMTAVLAGQLFAACAAISPTRSVVKDARQFAKAQGIDEKRYSASVLDGDDDYFVVFTRRSWPRKAGDHFAVRINKQTEEHRLVHGQ